MTLSLEIIAHRGYSAVAPENTIVALERALEAGADAVEFDLQVTACGTAILMHDATLDRTTGGSGAVALHRFDEIAHLDAGAWFAPAFAGEPVPDFADALARLKGRVGRVYAEVKDVRSTSHLDAMLTAVRAADLAYDTVFISMDWRALEHLAAADPDVGIGYIVEDRARWDEAVERASPSPRALIDVDHRIVLAEPDLVERARARDVETAVWTVDDPAEAERLAQAGVRRFTTNRVTPLLTWARSRPPAP